MKPDLRFRNRFVFQVGKKPARSFAIVFAGLFEMVFGFVFAFAPNFLNFAMHGDKEKEKDGSSSIFRR